MSTVSAFSSSVFFGCIGDTLGHQWSLIISGVVLVLAAALLYWNQREIFQVTSPAQVCSALNPSDNPGECVTRPRLIILITLVVSCFSDPTILAELFVKILFLRRP